MSIDYTKRDPAESVAESVEDHVGARSEDEILEDLLLDEMDRLTDEFQRLAESGASDEELDRSAREFDLVAERLAALQRRYDVEPIQPASPVGHQRQSSGGGSSFVAVVVVIGVILWILNSCGAFGGGSSEDDSYKTQRCAELQAQYTLQGTGADGSTVWDAVKLGDEANSLNCPAFH